MILPSAAGFGWAAGKSILVPLLRNFPSAQSSTGLYRSENKSSAEWHRLSNPLFPFRTLNSQKAPAPAAPPEPPPPPGRIPPSRGRARRPAAPRRPGPSAPRRRLLSSDHCCVRACCLHCGKRYLSCVKQTIYNTPAIQIIFPFIKKKNHMYIPVTSLHSAVLQKGGSCRCVAPAL